MDLRTFWSTHKFTLIIIFLGCLVYFNMLFNGFVWDDDPLIVNNDKIHSLRNVWIFFTNAPYRNAVQAPEGFYRPFMNLYFSLVYQISHAPFIFHIFQLIFHIINTFIVFKLFKLFLKEKLAFALSLLFLVHPMNVEAVSYISATQDILCFMFGVLALFVLRKNKLNVSQYVLSVALLISSTLMRESGFMFIAPIIFYTLIYKKENLKQVAVVIGSTMLLYVLLRFGIGKVYYFAQDISPIMMLPLSERLVHIPKIIEFYIRTFFFPNILTTSRLWVIKAIDFNSFYFPILFDLVFGVVLFVFGYLLFKKDKKKFSTFIFFFLWFASSLFIFLNIVPLDFTVTERWFYSPMVGIIGMAGVLIQVYYSIFRTYRKPAMFVFVSILVLLSVRTMIRNTNWLDKWTLYSHDIQITQDSFDLHNNYGVELMNKNRFEEAIPHFIESSRLAPHKFTSYSNLGVAYTRKNDIASSEKYFKLAMADNDNFYAPYQNLGYLYLTQGKYNEAKDILQKGLNKYPAAIPLWVYLTKSEYKLGNKDAAVAAAYQVYQLEPNDLNFQVYSLLKEGKELNF